MRIMHVISAMAAGGAETLVRDLSLSLASEGHEPAVTFISRSSGSRADIAFEEDFSNQLAAHAIPVFEIGRVARRNPILGGLRLRQALGQFRPDILHVHLATALVFRMSALSSVPTVYTHHNVRFRFPPLLLRAFDRVVDHYVAISDTNMRILKSLTKKPVTRIYNGVAGARFDGVLRRRPSTNLNVLSVGRIHPQKDYKTLIDVAALVAAQMRTQGRVVKFRIAGGGPELDELRHLAAERNLGDVVDFLGTRTDVSSLMAQSDVLLMTSIYEGLPISLIEAFHSGLPVVATNVGGCGEIVQHGVSGLLAQPGNAHDIADKLLALLSDMEALQRFSKNAQSAASRFSIAVCAQRHVELYHHVIAARTTSH